MRPRRRDLPPPRRHSSAGTRTRACNVVGFDKPDGIRLAYAGPAPGRADQEPAAPVVPRPAPGARLPAVLRGTCSPGNGCCAGTPAPAAGGRSGPALRSPAAARPDGRRRTRAPARGRRLRPGARVAQRRRAARRGDRAKARAELVALAPDDQVLVVVQAHRPVAVRLGRAAAAASSGRASAARSSAYAPARPDHLAARRRRRRAADLPRPRCFETSNVDELAAALPPSTLVSADDDGFCLREKGPDGESTSCYTWKGRPRTEPPPGAEPVRGRGRRSPPALIDSGISRCRWHRVRVDADVPAGTAVSVDDRGVRGRPVRRHRLADTRRRASPTSSSTSRPAATSPYACDCPATGRRPRCCTGSGWTSRGRPAPTCCPPRSARTRPPTTSPSASCRCSTPRSPRSTR